MPAKLRIVERRGGCIEAILAAVADRGAEIKDKLDPDRQVFFNDNLRMYSYTMAYLSQALRKTVPGGGKP